MTDTIEKNHESLNAVKVEHEYSFDPLFQKLSNAFDDGGAKGMLLYNMVTSFNPCLFFAFSLSLSS
jgi:condensin complex subunit 2